MRAGELYDLLREFISHHSTCSLFRCVACGGLGENLMHYTGTVDSHRFTALPCDCGLDEALAQWGKR